MPARDCPGHATVNFAIIFGLFCLFLLFSGTFPGWPILAVLPVIAIAVTLALGLARTLGRSTAFFRDVGQAFGILLQFWFWLTPIVYPASILPPPCNPGWHSTPWPASWLRCKASWPQAGGPTGASPWPAALLGLALCALGLQILPLPPCRRHAVDEL